MKVEYDTDQRNTQEPVALLDEDGDLVLLNPYEDGGWLMADDCNVFSLDQDDVTEAIFRAQRMLYPGDKITITF